MFPEEQSTRQMIVAAVLAALFIGVGYYTAGLNQKFLRRAIFLGLVLTGGLLLSPSLRIVPPLFAFAADAFFLASGPNAADLLLWAVFFGLPFAASEVLGGTGEAEESAAGSDSGEGAPDTSASSRPTANNPGTSGGSSDPQKVVQKLRQLLLAKMEQATDDLGLVNLLYYHVRNQKALLGYKINRLGEINQDLSFTADVGQGVGWVLRQEKSLTLRGQSLDWRNLQYHTRPVELERVEFHPVFSEDELIGVLGLEWKETAKFDETATEDFVGEAKKLLALDYVTRDLVKNQDKLELLEELYTVNPLGGDDFRDTISRVLEFVRDYLPADHVKFLETEDSLAGVSPPARRKIYESCRKWILNSGEVLRIEDVRKESLSGRRLDRFGGSELCSFLGGVVRAGGEEPLGLIFLDSSEPGCFNREDEKIFVLILDYLEQLLETAEEVRLARHQSGQLEDWVERLSELPVPAGQQRRCDEIGEMLYEKLDPLGLALYCRNNSGFNVVSSNEVEDFDREVDVDSSLVNRLSGSDRSLLSFPDVNKFKDFEAPLDCDSLGVLTVTGKKNRIEMFLVLFFRDSSRLESEEFKLFKQTSGLLGSWLNLTSREMNALTRAARDSVTSLQRFSPWKRAVEEKLQRTSESVVVWEFRVPGLERIETECGRKKANNWMRSISRLIDEVFPEATVCRFLGSNFYGFETTARDREELEKDFGSLQAKLEDWSFPAGDWPGRISWELEIHSPPFPPIEKVLESLRYSRQQSGNTGQDEPETESETEKRPAS